MKRICRFFIFLCTMSILACGLFGSSTSYSDPTKPIAPMSIGSDLTHINLCEAIPQEDIEAVMGRKLVRAPEKFDYYETVGSSGCTYDAGKDADGEAHFGYVVLTPLSEYDNQPLYEDVEVSGIGGAAYFNNGADARQLWVRLKDKVAFVVAFGDLPNEEGTKAIAELLVDAIQ